MRPEALLSSSATHLDALQASSSAAANQTNELVHDPVDVCLEVLPSRTPTHPRQHVWNKHTRRQHAQQPPTLVTTVKSSNKMCCEGGRPTINDALTEGSNSTTKPRHWDAMAARAESITQGHVKQKQWPTHIALSCGRTEMFGSDGPQRLQLASMGLQQELIGAGVELLQHNVGCQRRHTPPSIAASNALAADPRPTQPPSQKPQASGRRKKCTSRASPAASAPQRKSWTKHSVMTPSKRHGDTARQPSSELYLYGCPCTFNSRLGVPPVVRADAMVPRSEPGGFAPLRMSAMHWNTALIWRVPQPS